MEQGLETWGSFHLYDNTCLMLKLKFLLNTVFQIHDNLRIFSRKVYIEQHGKVVSNDHFARYLATLQNLKSTGRFKRFHF